MKSLKEMRSKINEVLSKSDPIEKWISDFVHSKDPKFDGKSKEERIKMAKGAYYGAKKEGVMQPNGTDKVGRIQEGENKQMKGKDPCWKDYEMVGTKKKNGKEVPNCVPKNESEIPLSDKEKNKMLSNKDKSTLGKIHSLMQKQKKEGYKSDAQRKAVWASKNEKGVKEEAELDETLTPQLVKQGIGIARDKRYAGNNMTGATKAMDKLHRKLQNHPRVAAELKKQNEEANPEAASKQAKKAQMAAKHAGEKESLAKKHERERESMKESSASKLVQTKLGSMDRKNVRIPSPAERRAEMEKRKQMQKEDTTMLSFDEYLEEDMRIAKATSFAKKHANNMNAAVKKIERIRKGLTNHPKVKAALRKYNEELSDKQKKLDHNKNGKIDGADLAKTRGKKEVNELNKSTLQSYANKAHQDSMNKAYDAAHTGDSKESDKLHKQAVKRADNVKKADMKASMKKEEVDAEVEPKSYKDFINEMQGGRYVHKGTRYGGAAQRDVDHEADFGIDNEKEKFKRLLQKKPGQKKPAQVSTVKKGRGRPMGSKSGARN